MVRVKRWLMTKKRHSKMIKSAKWFRMMNWNVFSRVKNALMKAWTNAYKSRRLKKRDFRRLWTVRISNAVRELGLNYSTFINMLYQAKVKLNRKVLSNLAISNPMVFSKIVKFTKK